MRYIVTSALPYANASLHLGHMLEAIQTDIWVRSLNLDSHQAYYFCASDTHGTPVMLKAKELSIKPEDLVNKMKIEHQKTFEDFNINLTNFHTTHSEESEELTLNIFNKLSKNKKIYTKDIIQLFDEKENIFLSDRFVKGTCPACGAADQYGDACEVCGKTYDALDLIDPISTLSSTTPVQKKSSHYFFSLSEFKDFLKIRVSELSDQKPVIHKINEWLEDDLKDWDVSRDEPYFGFKIPGEESKFIYVWLDAPVGYFASIKNWCDQNNHKYEDFLDKDSKLVHFIGKDIMYFHLLFWPSTLHAAQVKQPDEVFVHGFMTIEGNKMSKSRGNFITANDALTFADADFYRYYIASKLNNDISDLDFSVQDFIQKINSDLVGKFINIPSRTSKFIQKYGDSKVLPNSMELIDKYKVEFEKTISLVESRNYSQALKLIMSIADEVNTYISIKEPWTLAKDNNIEECLEVCSNALAIFCSLNVLLTPFMPNITNKISAFLKVDNLKYSDIYMQCINEINEYDHIIKRLDAKDFEGMVTK